MRVRWAAAVLLAAFPIVGAAQSAPLAPHRATPVALRRIPDRGTPFTAPRASRGDRWFGADKARHAGSSGAIQIMGFGVLRSARVRQPHALLGASVMSLAAGVGKELVDRRGGGDPSLRDLLWDVVGIGLGSGLALAADVR